MIGSEDSGIQSRVDPRDCAEFFLTLLNMITRQNKNVRAVFVGGYCIKRSLLYINSGDFVALCSSVNVC